MLSHVISPKNRKAIFVYKGANYSISPPAEIVKVLSKTVIKARKQNHADVRLNQNQKQGFRPKKLAETLIKYVLLYF